MINSNTSNPNIPNLREYLHCDMEIGINRNYGTYDLNENEGSEFCRRYGDGGLQGIEVDVDHVFVPQDPFIRCNKIIRNDEYQQETVSREIQQDNQIITIVDEPFVGMEFNSHDEAYHFYNAYAKSVGFSTRIGGHYRSKADKTIISRDFYCSKEGFRKRPGNEEPTRVRPIMREGCKAKLTIKKRNDKWQVTKFEENHNHELAAPSKVHLLRSHKKNPNEQRILTNSVSSIGENVTNIMNVFTQSVAGVQIAGQTKLGTLGIDGHALLNYFKSMQAKNPTFFYAIQVDHDYSLSNIFWVDARSRSSYKYFCDVISLDMTYKKNRCYMPFVPITGVNHHRQSISLGCALLSDESESTFIWLFETWLQAMNYQHPISIITDQDMAIKAAVAKVFPQTHHKFCKWHILDKLYERLSHLHKDLHQEIDVIVNSSYTIDDFEKAWQTFIENYDLEEDVQALYIDRNYWVPAYLKDAFSAGMSTVDQGECIRSLFDGQIHTKTTLNAFIRQYEKALENQYEKEMQEEFNFLNHKLILKTPIPMAEQTSEVYTRKNFSLFQEEIVQSLALTVRNVGGDGSCSTYLVKKYGTSHKEYTVYFNNTTKEAACSCRKFDFEGIICRHILATFQREDIFELAPRYILRRWTKDAKTGNAQDDCIIGYPSYGLDSITMRYNSLCQEAMKCIERGACSIESYDMAAQGLRELYEKLLFGNQSSDTLQTIDKSEIATTEGEGYNNMALEDPTVGKANVSLSKDVVCKKSSEKPSKRVRKLGSREGYTNHAFRQGKEDFDTI